MTPDLEPRPQCHQDCPSWQSNDPAGVCQCDDIRTPELRLPTRAELRHIPLTACELDLREGA